MVIVMTNNGQNEGASIHKVTADQAEPERRECDEQFRELMAHLQQVFWIKNAADGSVLYISPAYETVCGRTCQSLYKDSQTFLDAIHAEDRERVAAAIAGQRQTGGYAEEYRIVRPDGAIRWIWAQSYPVRDGQGQVIRFAGIAEDITERKLLEQDRARLAAIVEYSEDVIVGECGGHIDVCSEVGKRTTFNVYFPVVGESPGASVLPPGAGGGDASWTRDVVPPRTSHAGARGRQGAYTGSIAGRVKRCNAVGARKNACDCGVGSVHSESTHRSLRP